MMKRGKGATLAEIMKATGWEPEVRDCVGILDSESGETIESSKNAPGERTFRMGKIASVNSLSKRRLGHAPGAAFLLLHPE